MSFRGLLVLSFLAAASPAATADASRPLQYTRDIRPILSRNCFPCHGPDAENRQAGLRLDVRADACGATDDHAAAIRPRNSGASELIRRLAAGESERMPPPDSGRRLTADEQTLLRRWIDEGAPYDAHWAYEPIRRPALPALKNPARTSNPIDRFILDELVRSDLEPSPEADRFTLIRRLSLDLIGLPPTWAEVDAFVHDSAPGAYERVVERLLASPQFGERWGRHWLDLARYADSDGYLGDDLRPHAFRYRDWVIESLNRDQPFDQFTIDQIAGDLLPGRSLDQQIATGFHRNSMKNTEAGADREEDRVNQAVDRISTVGTVWLGLTVGCAQCHTHKFDPITHAEFYQLFAFFNDAEDRDIPLPAPELAAQKEAHRAWTSERDAAAAEVRAALSASSEKEIASILKLLAKPASRRDDDEESRLMSATEDLTAGQKQTLDAYEEVIGRQPVVIEPKAPAIARPKSGRTTRIHERGDFRRPGAEVEPGTPAFLPPLRPRAGHADRLDFARWIVDPDNPLTGRVAVNHIWKHLFGRGLVHPADNFGVSGQEPSHSELLDWLASEFVERGWSRKQLIRLIVTSSTYRQTSNMRPDLEAIDPLNRLLARQSRFRNEAEIVRDSALAVSGLLERTVGGPSIRPPLNSRLTAISRNREWDLSPIPERYRRGMYVLQRRATPYPMLVSFDAPDTTAVCTDRERSNTPLQALMLLNDVVFMESARQLGRTCEESGAATEASLKTAFQTALGRSPTAREELRLRQLHDQNLSLAGRLSADECRALAGAGRNDDRQIDRAAWVLTARSLLNLDEFMTRE
jgi:hypothetical protein